MQVVVRPPKIEDAEGLAHASQDLAAQYAEVEPERFHVPAFEQTVAWLRSAIEKPRADGSVWLVAELDDEAVGDAKAQLHEPMSNAGIQPQLDVGRRRAYLGWLAVQSAHQGHGVGGRLLAAVEEWAREHGAELITTDTNLRSNLGAVEFYERNGYERQAVILRKPLA
ncbi:MAG TPA: GNAT family N-acetyltransferase [Gaiellaceae bacterium]